MQNLLKMIIFVDMERKKITFDLFIRGILVVMLLVGLLWLLKRLSGVLLPFFVAWLIAYMLFPLVKFFQYKCRLKYRVLGIFAAIIVALGVLYLVGMMIFPPMWDGIVKVNQMLISFIETGSLEQGSFAANVREFLAAHLDIALLKGAFTLEGVMALFKEAMPRLWGVVTTSFKAISGLFSVVMVLLYTFFILLDYEKLTTAWPSLLPERIRKYAVQIVKDMRHGMNKYFRGQALVALCVGILFSIGFLIIGFPMAVALGLFIGLLNMVPYLQVVGFIPTIILALIKSAETGESFWSIFLLALLVFAIVQTIQDTILVPKIMGKVMGMNSAIILLSLSIWGSLLGVLGMLIALPLTTLILTYYQRYVIKTKEISSLEQ